MKPETIQVLKDTIIQWVKDYNMLDSIIEVNNALLDDLESKNKRYKEFLRGLNNEEDNEIYDK